MALTIVEAAKLNPGDVVARQSSRCTPGNRHPQSVTV